VEAQGDAVATFSVVECPNTTIQYVSELTSGVWSAPERLGSGGGGGGRVAVNPAGDAIAVWFGLSNTEYSLKVSQRAPSM